MNQLFYSEEVFRQRDIWHGELVLQGAGLQGLEGGLADQDGLPVLDGLHGAHGETAAVSRAVHMVQHWNLRIPWETPKTVTWITFMSD